MPIELSRRNFFAGAGAAAVGALYAFNRRNPKKKYAIPGSLLGPDAKSAHLMRDGISLKPDLFEKAGTVIVGGGIAGLSAAWWLKKNGYQDFILLELDKETGGNSRSGENAISKYPWAAHYVPLPGREAHYVRELLQELGVITGYSNGLPVYNEMYLCADPHERLFFQGQWHEGLVPQHGVPAEERRQYSEFFSFTETLKKTRGNDGRLLFEIPLDQSSRDPHYLNWDKISMADLMRERGWDSKYLHWYIRYCMRDDYGVAHDQVSAWAGLHYFASRAGLGANADRQSVLTWPEGNGWLANHLAAKVQEHLQTQRMAFSIRNHSGGCSLDVLNTADQSCIRYEARNVIYCAPRFTARRVIQGYVDRIQQTFSPWLVANISVSEKPAGAGAPLSWDNVSFYSDSLGYIVATQQDLRLNRAATVLTYYLPLDQGPDSRHIAAAKSHQDWLDIIVPDLEKMHPGISAKIVNVDAWVWGHGMVSPGIGYLWSEERRQRLQPFGRVHFAHTDMSGISIFEEAQYRGVEAAKQILAKGLT